MKLILILAAATLLAACESTSTTKDTSGNGTPLGDNNVRVSGYVQTGGTMNAR